MESIDAYIANILAASPGDGSSGGSGGSGTTNPADSANGSFAVLSVKNRLYNKVTVKITGLQYAANEYDSFWYIFSQNETVILIFEYKFSSTTKDPELNFVTTDYGLHWFAPNTTYSVQVLAWYGGNSYAVSGSGGGAVSFTTTGLRAPSGTIDPVMWPTIKNQDQSGSCVAQALTTAMELFSSKAKGVSESYENYSPSYFYGSDGRAENADYGMRYDEALNLAVSTGAPRWELVDTYFKQDRKKIASVALFRGACTMAHENAQKHRISGYDCSVSFYDGPAVADAIRTNGCYAFTFRVPYNFWNSWGVHRGVADQPAGGWNGAGHMILLIGLTTKNGKPHWIAVNSWGTQFGDPDNPGIYYIPYDWGCGVQSPQDGAFAEDGDFANWTPGWVTECAALHDYSVPVNNPDVPELKELTRNGTSLTVEFEKADSSGAVLVYARKKGTEEWFPKPGYGEFFLTSPATITLDSATDEYEVSIIAVRDNMLSDRNDGSYSKNCFIYIQGQGFVPCTPYLYDYNGKNPTPVSAAILNV